MAKAAAKQAAMPHPEGDSDQELAQVHKGRQAAKKPKFGATKPKAASHPAEEQSEEVDLSLVPKVRSSEAFGLLYLTFASKQSYIRMGQEKRLLVGCSQTQSPHHSLVIHELCTWICGKDSSLTKQQVIEKRNDWLQRLKA